MKRHSISRLRQEVWAANLQIFRGGLVTMHSGNASGIDRQRGIIVIKPSGMDYERLRPRDLVLMDLEGRKVEGQWKPSVDFPHHAYLYRHCPEIGGVIHTHSTYATCFALLGQPIPAYLTAIADEFGAGIPCTPYVDNEGDHIGEAILKYRNKAPAILLGNHGAFAWGASPRAALKAAIMLEDVAKTCYLALALGKPQALPEGEVEKWYRRYHTTYGQVKIGD